MFVTQPVEGPSVVPELTVVVDWSAVVVVDPPVAVEPVDSLVVVAGSTVVVGLSVVVEDRSTVVAVVLGPIEPTVVVESRIVVVVDFSEAGEDVVDASSSFVTEVVRGGAVVAGVDSTEEF